MNTASILGISEKQLALSLKIGGMLHACLLKALEGLPHVPEETLQKLSQLASQEALAAAEMLAACDDLPSDEILLEAACVSARSIISQTIPTN